MTRMPDICSTSHLPVLAAFASSNVLLAFDYDGTLAPIVPIPSRARMRRETRQLLIRVARVYPCVVISGRRLDDVTRRLNGISVWYVFGNFGHEPSRQGERPSRVLRNWMHQLTQRLPTHRGLVIEEKQYSVTIHYRNVRNKRRALAAIDDAVRGLQDARILGGSQAVNLLPRGGPDKGVALQQARHWFKCTTAIYVGDDDTDEDAFASGYPDRLLSIRVGPSEASHARYRLKRQADIDALLRALLAFRPSHRIGTRRTRPVKERNA